MTENTSTPPPETVTDRLDRTIPALSPDVRSIAFDALEPVDYSFPVALFRTSAEAVSSELPPDQPFEAISIAIGALQGYVRLRTDLLEDDRYTSPADRDAAILAGDYLHAFAHASIGDLSTDDARRLELFRVLTSGSNTLARAFQEPDQEPEHAESGPPTRTESDPEATVPSVSAPPAILAGIAAELGATAAGANETVREVTRTYGCSLSRALTTVSLERGGESGDSPDDEPRSVAIRVLWGRSAELTPDSASNGRNGRSPGESGAEPDHHDRLERELEHARTALETLETVDAFDRSAADNTSGKRGPTERERTDRTAQERAERREAGRTDRVERTGLTPRDRLERATQIPFEGVLVSDE